MDAQLLVLERVAFLSIAFKAWKSGWRLGGGEQKALLFTICVRVSEGDWMASIGEEG